MTIQGAIAELQNLLEVDDVPFYYKGGIKKVIETIQMEMSHRKTEPQTSVWTSGVVWTEDAIKNEPKPYTTWASTDEPQTDCNGCIYLHCNGECGEE